MLFNVNSQLRTQAQAGNTVHIKAGDYDTEHVVIINSGTTMNPIVFEGYKDIPGDIPELAVLPAPHLFHKLLGNHILFENHSENKNGKELFNPLDICGICLRHKVTVALPIPACICSGHVRGGSSWPFLRRSGVPEYRRGKHISAQGLHGEIL